MTMIPEFHEFPSVARFISSFAGTCVLRRDPDFDEARAVWNASTDGMSPLIIARPEGAQGVGEAVRFAVQHRLPLAVRSGGHSPAGFGTVDGGMVLDLSSMKAIEIDPETRRVRLEPGLTWAEVAWALHAHGLAITSGDVGTVGVGGLTQGGGIGWFVRKHGLATDRLRAAELVTATGELLRCSETEHPEVFWALRGAGANLGVITALEFEAHSAGMVEAGLLLFDASDPAEAARLIGTFAKVAQAAPDELTVQALFMAAPPAPFVPPHLIGRTVLMVLGCYSGAPEDATAALAPLRALGPVVADLMGAMPYPAIFALSAAGEQRGFHQVSRSGFLQDVSETGFLPLTRALQSMPPGLLVQVRPLGGELARLPESMGAFSHRLAPFLLMINQAVPTPELAGTANKQVEALWTRVAGYACGLYGNFASETDLNGSQPAYRLGTQERLARVKARLDPHNLFARNVNVRPAEEVLSLS